MTPTEATQHAFAIGAVYAQILECRVKLTHAIDVARAKEPHNLPLFQHLTSAALFLDDALKHLSQSQ